MWADSEPSYMNEFGDLHVCLQCFPRKRNKYSIPYTKKLQKLYMCFPNPEYTNYDITYTYPTYSDDGFIHAHSDYGVHLYTLSMIFEVYVDHKTEYTPIEHSHQTILELINVKKPLLKHGT
jgi:hypothetical protein